MALTKVTYPMIDGSITDGGFWPDVGTNAPIIADIRDRVFVDKAAEFNGNFYDTSNGMSPAPTWVSAQASNLTWSSVGRIATSGVSKTSLADGTPYTPPYAIAAVGVSGVAIGDYTGADYRVPWGGYFEAWKGAGSQNAAFGVELDIGNDSAVNGESYPNLLFGANTIGLNIAAGGSKGTAYANPSAAALTIANNTQTFNKGIIFGSNSLTGCDGATGSGIAISMAKGHVINWYNNSNQQTSVITSNVSSGTNYIGIALVNDGVWLERGGSLGMQFDFSAGTGNYFQISSNASGSAPSIQAKGVDTDVDLQLITKGAGYVKFGNRTGTADAPITGYIEIKDNGGTVRKLAVIS